MPKKDDFFVENRALRAEIRRLERENSSLRKRLGDVDMADRENELWQSEGKKITSTHHRGYFSYVFSSLKDSYFWSVYLKLLSYFRRFRLFSLILRGATRVVLWAESGVALLASFSAAILLLPFLLLIVPICLSVAFIRSRRANRYFARIARGKRVYILSPAKKQLSENDSFFCTNVRDLASDGSICLVVSPYFFGREGMGGKGFYINARDEGSGVFMIRKYYYFMLFRRIVAVSENTIVL